MSMRFTKKCFEISSADSYNIDNAPATPLAARPSATGQVVSYNSTRRASDRKVKQAGFLFAGAM